MKVLKINMKHEAEIFQNDSDAPQKTINPRSIPQFPPLKGQTNFDRKKD